MAEILLLIVFAGALIASVAVGISILIPLLFGCLLFFGYGLWKTHSLKSTLSLALSGVLTVKNVIITLVFIGMITAVWRCCGTIAFVVYSTAGLCTPSLVVLASFLLCCLMSVLTGTAFGSAATMGVICMTISNSMGAPAALTGGAILAGVYFGDRCSPMSSSATLVSELTGTNIFENIRAMVKTALVPFVISCVVYLLLGFTFKAAPSDSSVRDIFLDNYALPVITVIPAVLIIVLSLFRLNVKLVMACSIVSGVLISVFVQDMDIWETLGIMVMGFHPEDGVFAALMGGGGIVSMVKVICIIIISACYSGIFRGTGFLSGVQGGIDLLAKRITVFGSVAATALVSVMVACNQTLGIMLTAQLCEHLEPDGNTLAIDLENSVVVLSAFIPWSVSFTVPAGAVDAPLSCLPFACYLWLLPLFHFIFRKMRSGKEPNPCLEK